MSVLWDYWARWASRLAGDFERVRAGHSDSAVKGVRNEKIIAEFLGSNMGPRRVATNAQIIDSHGHSSDEVDAIVLNEYQPFNEGDGGALLIVEGVDAVVQVKAVLNTQEIERSVKNCRSVKQLRRKFVQGAQMWAVQADVESYVHRVPYFVFAFESQVQPASAVARFTESCLEVPPEERPDGAFVLDHFSVLNVRDNEGKLRMSSESARGFQGVISPTSHVLPLLMWCLHVTVPRINHLGHPVMHYGFGEFVSRSADT